MDWILTSLTCITLWLMGSKSIWGVRLSLFNQILWGYYTLHTKQYGLFFGVIVYAIIAVRNLIKWEKEK